MTRAELAADPAHVHVHGAAVLRYRPAVVGQGAVPDPLDQFGPGEHRAGVCGEERQQLEFLEGERDLAPVGPGAALGVVQLSELRFMLRRPTEVKAADPGEQP